VIRQFFDYDYKILDIKKGGRTHNEVMRPREGPLREQRALTGDLAPQLFTAPAANSSYQLIDSLAFPKSLSSLVRNSSIYDQGPLLVCSGPEFD